jgi:hypothetical protein
MKNRISIAVFLGFLPSATLATNRYICPAGSCCEDGLVKPCGPNGTKYCPEEGTVCGRELDCPAGRTCVDGQVSGNCQDGMYIVGESVACTPCPAGSKCAGGTKTDCAVEGIFSFQDQGGQSACKQCANNQVGNLAGTGCTDGTLGTMETPSGNRVLSPGVYNFEISGGGGGSGSTTCSNCGKYGSSQPGGYGERKKFTVSVLAETTAVISTGAAGGGGHNGNTSRGNDTEGTIDTEWYRTNSCTYSCTQSVDCNNGSDGGTTTVTIDGTAYSAAGGHGGKGKTWLVNENGGSFADMKAATHAPACAANPDDCGSAGGRGVVQDTSNGHSYWSDGYAGDAGYVRYWKLERN